MNSYVYVHNRYYNRLVIIWVKGSIVDPYYEVFKCDNFYGISVPFNMAKLSSYTLIGDY